MHRRHLQEIPDLGSNITTSIPWSWHPNKTSGLLSGMGVSPLKLDSENTPQDLLMCVGPPTKRQKVRETKFVIIHQPRLLQETVAGVSWDTLPDELLLGIFSYLNLTDLLKVSQVCQRWHRLSLDESLWQSLDLASKNLLPGVIGQLLPLGIITFRCPRSCIGTPLFKTSRALCVQHLDLSNCSIKVIDLEDIIGRCQSLQNLSLEGLILSSDIVRSIAQNPNLARLNLSGCSGFSADTVEVLLKSCLRLEELNLGWCDFTAEHLKNVVSHIPSKLLQLNLSGYRQNLLIPDVKTLLERCSGLIHLDLSDSVMLKPECFAYFHQLTHLEHLSLSRCYQIPPAALLELGEIATLKTLQVFGIVTANSLQLLKATLPHIKINTSYFSPIARPTIGCKKNQEIWGIQCKLNLRNLAGV
ncbi:S-phase kinase-associated protein 2 [Notechis scutatus]|uniref:S-phase kinase-associated protein 2 n=1 Tax=Notechis scutatus TaxID=8663 RepID=A0A6J1U0L5_9SAUR|nr:S-phase kinase-associated protein 2 [Notechis scutatus]